MRECVGQFMARLNQVIADQGSLTLSCSYQNERCEGIIAWIQKLSIISNVPARSPKACADWGKHGVGKEFSTSFVSGANRQESVCNEAGDVFFGLRLTQCRHRHCVRVCFCKNN